MIDLEKVRERKKIREQILTKLYVQWFGPEPNASALVGTKHELYPDSEHHRAFHYLAGKGLIDISPTGQGSGMNEVLAVFISAKGIDYVEELVEGKS
ncbi:hypothetical protein [Paenibacillus zanthoxyli]|uniref:hypothetical protein n=1 Tax=Paenibacillus zanthoxyli TaxID=369399 RepID=UPI0004717FED|nr:hypothetical protein [Paenibacillus zanthoxyli]